MRKIVICISLCLIFCISSLLVNCAIIDEIDDLISDIVSELESEESVKNDSSEESVKNDSSEESKSISGTEDKESSQVGINPDDIFLYSPVLCGHMFSSQIFFMFPFYYDNVKDFPEAFSFRVICNRIGYDFTVYETPTGMCFYNIDMKHPYNVSYQNLSSGFLLNNELLGIPDSGNIEIADITHWGYDLPYFQGMPRYPLYVYKF